MVLVPVEDYASTSEFQEQEDKFTKYKKEYEYFNRLHQTKYRDTNQTKNNHDKQLAHSLASNEEHYNKLYDIIHNHRFLCAGRVQAALGATEREVSPFNCSVSQKVTDSIDGIYKALHMSAKILRLGTGIGYNFSPIRPEKDLIVKLQSFASGPLGYMELFNTSAKLIASAGHRRGAQMGILNVNHPDVEKFITAKMEKDKFSTFNFSVAITDDFMFAVENNLPWTLTFNNKIYKTIDARELWDKIMKSAYESAEPGVIFIDTVNKTNNLYYCEEIEATNPCAEQPLPPYGLCTLGSFNLVAYLYEKENNVHGFNYDLFDSDIKNIVEAYDNIFERALYAIPEHKEEALSKRRIGLGLTGIANAIEILVGESSYGEEKFNKILEYICANFMDRVYEASIELAKERGAFPLFDKEKYLQGEFIKELPFGIQEGIRKYGIRNSHLISYAPCGTISQCAWNVSSGVEPTFHHKIKRKVLMPEGEEIIEITDFNLREYNFKSKTLEECTVEQHLAVSEICQKYCDSAVSKTINMPVNSTYEEYKETYIKAHKLGLKGVTIYRPTELRGSIIEKAEQIEDSTSVTNTSELNTARCASGVCER